MIELSITSKVISETSLSYLAQGIENNTYLKKLILNKLSLGYSKSFVSFIAAIQENTAIEYLDLSENVLNDDAGSFISCLIEFNSCLRVLILDHNKIKDFSFALSLTKNKSLLEFSLNYNPIEFVNIISLLEMLTINKTLQYLGVKGIAFKGPAPIKENPSGLLNMDEAIILKLANVLRYSYICSISIDVNPTASLQLKELEVTIIKHNKTLMKIDSDSHNWSQPNDKLYGIYRALKANQWLINKNTETPSDIQDILNIKLNPKKNEILNNSSDTYKLPSVFSPVKAFEEFKSSVRKNSWESKNSESTIIETKSIKEMSFGKSNLNKSPKEDDVLIKYLQNMNDKIQNLEQKFSKHLEKTEVYIEKADDLSSSRLNEIGSINTALKDIQSRLDKFEREKISHEGVVEDYIQRLESLKFSKDALESSRRSSKRLRPQKKDSSDYQGIHSFENTEESIKSDSMSNRLLIIEERLQKVEQNSEKIHKVKEKLKGTIVISIQTKVSKIESIVQNSPYTPKKMVTSDMQTTQKNMKSCMHLPGDAESVVINALMEKAKYNRINESFSRNKTPVIGSHETRRVPSTELKRCLKSRGFVIEGDKPVFRNFNYYN